MTYERSQEVLFVEGYLDTDYTFLIDDDAPDIESLEDIRGQAIAVNNGSVYDVWATENADFYDLEVQRYGKNADAVQAVLTGRAFANLAGESVAKWAAMQSPLVRTTYTIKSGSKFSAAFRNEDVEYRNRVEAVLECMKSDGTMVLNADDPHVQAWAARAEGRNVVRFSYENAAGDAQYFASSVEERSDGTSQFNLHAPQGEQALSIRFLGRHNVLNAIAASAAAMEAGASLNDVVQGLSSLEPVAGRLSRVAGINGCQLIDDSYNASPGSFFAAIDVLSSLQGYKLLVMGDMKELGADTDSAHASVGEYASMAAIDEFWTIGEKSRLAIDAYAGRGRHFDSKEALVEAITSISRPELTVLVKGSRGARMNEIVSALKNNGETQC